MSNLKKGLSYIELFYNTKSKHEGKNIFYKIWNTKETTYLKFELVLTWGQSQQSKNELGIEFVEELFPTFSFQSFTLILIFSRKHKKLLTWIFNKNILNIHHLSRFYKEKSGVAITPDPRACTF